MSKKKDGSGGHLAVTLAATGGAFVLRKVLAIAWTKVTLPEALIWSVILAAIVETARFGITRAARRQAPSPAADAESP